MADLHFRDIPIGKGAYCRAYLVNDRERVVRVWAPRWRTSPPACPLWLTGRLPLTAPGAQRIRQMPAKLLPALKPDSGPQIRVSVRDKLVYYITNPVGEATSADPTFRRMVIAEIWQSWDADPDHFRKLREQWHINPGGDKNVPTGVDSCLVPMREAYAGGLLYFRTIGGCAALIYARRAANEDEKLQRP